MVERDPILGEISGEFEIGGNSKATVVTIIVVVMMVMMELVYRGLQKKVLMAGKKGGNFKGKLLVSVRLGAIIRQQW